ncbi:FUSC family protein [Paraburkholderia antibiotica]|uniref:FUSC family protein n=1 Tax=Paraburkholderia antibiotica TaxID=2728839 RepID=A0A7X9X7C3_9BURK|nr:FUSC family protein [Paraburkholderia antibiotica]NML32834.1 FUSC family protein [Paraburkholderia antibiotica]
MTPSDDSRPSSRTRAADALFAFLKSLPLGDRLIEGGFMAVQAVAGASLAFGIGRALHTEQAFWAAITAIAVSQHSYVDTRKLSRDQFIGAMVGGICGLIGTLAGGGHFAAYAATVAIAILICWVVNVGSAARLGGITATIMLLVPGIGPAWDKAFLRLAEVTLGTVCALLIARLMASIERRAFSKAEPPK